MTEQLAGPNNPGSAVGERPNSQVLVLPMIYQAGDTARVLTGQIGEADDFVTWYVV